MNPLQNWLKWHETSFVNSSWDILSSSYSDVVFIKKFLVVLFFNAFTSKELSGKEERLLKIINSDFLNIPIFFYADSFFYTSKFSFFLFFFLHGPLKTTLRNIWWLLFTHIRNVSQYTCHFISLSTQNYFDVIL